MKLNRPISKVAVVGSGIMGSRIACHFANIGVEVLLLDIVPFELTEEEKNDKKIRNSIVNSALQDTIKSTPSPIYSKTFISRITTGNIEDDLHKIERMIEDRNQFRNVKNFNRADEIRDELKSMGIEIEDTPGGTIWRNEN